MLGLCQWVLKGIGAAILLKAGYDHVTTRIEQRRQYDERQSRKAARRAGRMLETSTDS